MRNTVDVSSAAGSNGRQVDKANGKSLKLLNVVKHVILYKHKCYSHDLRIVYGASHEI